MKQGIKLIWQGVVRILGSVVSGIKTILGMNGNSKYAVALCRIVGTCLTIVTLLITAAIVYRFGYKACYRMNWLGLGYGYESLYEERILSAAVNYHHDDSKNDGYVFSNDGKKLIKGVQWISMPLGDDSLVVYSDGKKRGYFNKYTGEVVIKPRYNHAWVFSDGLASVEEDGYIKFIDSSGEVAFDPHIPYKNGMDGLVFHHDLCIMENDHSGGMGLVNKQGDWVLQPIYSSIEVADSFFVVRKQSAQAVFAANLSMVIPFINASLTVYGNEIEATMSDHTIRTYNLQGELTDDNKITETELLLYDTGEVAYTASYEYDEEGNVTNKTEGTNPTMRQAVAHCKRYQAEYGWYGLLSADGAIVSPPSFSTIIAIGVDQYLCKDGNGNGIILNDAGKRIE